MSTPKLDSIAAKGNRGHHHNRADRDSTIVCADGFKLSVIAGGGTYSTPRTDMCAHPFVDSPISGGSPLYKPCDYPGPYSAVEVMILDDTPYPDEWQDDGGVAGFVPVALVREFIESHGGER